MNALRVSPVVLSFVLLAAHFYRGGQVIVAAFCLGAPLLLFLRRSWVPRLFQVLLILGALEWLRTLYLLAAMRIAWEQPWLRLAAILITVALFTALSGLVFASQPLRARFEPEKP